MTDTLHRSSIGSAPAVAWPAIFAGATVALAISLIGVALGAGFSAGSFAAWPDLGRGLSTFTALTGVWLIITQWAASAAGGYITGRLRSRWHEVHSHEVFFRDTANGLVTWALATVSVAVLGAVISGAAVHGAAVPDMPSAGLQAAKKAAAGFAVFTAISMLVGAFVASVAAALGGQQRDEHA